METEKELKITVSFRIRPGEKEAILEIGQNSFSKGVSALLNYYQNNFKNETDELGYKIKAAQRIIDDIIKESGETTQTKNLQNQLNAYKESYLKRKMKDTKDIFREIQKVIN